jgi:predicted lipoprotein with Yx(FWY)xxD motif
MQVFSKTLWRLFVSVAFIVALPVMYLGCDDDDAPTNQTNVSLTEHNTLGSMLVDGDGMSLYFFTKDVDGETSTCAGGCLDAWPIFYVEEIKPGTGLDAVDFTNITRGDGQKQTMYKGWPLYYFASDAVAGETNGEGVNNVWYVAKPNYSMMLANAQLVGNDGKNYTSAFQEGTGETQYFVDAEGRTLYLFTKDYKEDNNFTAADFSNNDAWPVYYAEIDALPGALNKNDFGEIEVAGHDQLTYKGWPLYYFGQDTKRGNNKGVSVPTPGIWRTVNKETPAAVVKPTIKTVDNATFGRLLTDGDGHILYVFARDSKGSPSACAGGCLTRWPIFNSGDVILPEATTLDPDDFGSIGDGATKQTTYKGWPLYYFSPNNDAVIETAGQIGGDNFGTLWHVANPDYDIMIVNAQLVGLNGLNYLSTYVEGVGTTRYFTDSDGRTLYVFTNDSENTNTFTAADFSNDAAWPIVDIDIDKLPTGISAADFGQIDVHGRTQITYKGWPVYYFGQDAARGDNKGVSVGAPGKWPVINEATPLAPQ